MLRQLLPAEVEVPTSFETIGHVLHLNLKEQVPPPAAAPLFQQVFHFVTFEAQHAPYERVIADVLLDKVQSLCRCRCPSFSCTAAQVPNARTIVSKVGTIQNKFRVYDMKV